MTHIRADRICETSSLTGTGAYLLAGAVAGYRPFSAACAVGDTCEYFAESAGANGVLTPDFEVGLGTLGAGNTLQRTKIYTSSNANAAVNWPAGVKRIALTITAKTMDDITLSTVNAATSLIQTQKIMAQMLLAGQTP